MLSVLTLGICLFIADTATNSDIVPYDPDHNDLNSIVDYLNGEVKKSKKKSKSGYYSLLGIAHFHRLTSSLSKHDDLTKSYDYLSKTIELNPKNNRKDWVTFQYLGDWFLFFAKQKMQEIKSDDSDQDRKNIDLTWHALQEAIKYYDKYDKARSLSNPAENIQIEINADGSISSSNVNTNIYEPYYKAQKYYIKPRALVLKFWGDCHELLNERDKARLIYQKGVNENIWKSVWCRPGLIFPTLLQSQTYFYDAEMFENINKLKMNLPLIRDEILRNHDGNDFGLDKLREYGWVHKNTGLHKSFYHHLTNDRSLDLRTLTGGWYYLPFAIDGKFQQSLCEKYWDKTCKIIESLLDETDSLKNVIGQIKLSLLLPGARIRPHTGPRNDRLRLHCIILSPPNVAKIRVGPLLWKYYNNSDLNEECFIFDESCEHEVIFKSQDNFLPRIVLIMDFVNPFLNSSKKFISR